MAFGLDLSTLGNLGRAASRGIAQNTAFNEQQRLLSEQQRLLGGQEADRAASKLLLKAAVDPTRENIQAATDAMGNASGEFTQKATPLLVQLSQLGPKKAEAQRLQTGAGLRGQLAAREGSPTQDQRTRGEAQVLREGIADIEGGGEGHVGLERMMQIRKQTGRTIAQEKADAEAAAEFDPRFFKKDGAGNLIDIRTGKVVGGRVAPKGVGGAPKLSDAERMKNVLPQITTAAFKDAIAGDSTPGQTIEAIKRSLRQQDLTLAPDEEAALIKEASTRVLSPLQNITGSQQTKLDGALQVQSISDMALQKLDDPKVAAAVGKLGGTLTAVTAWIDGSASMPPEVNEFLTLIGMNTDYISRKQSGAALTVDEQNFYKSLTGDVFTSAEAIRTKLETWIDVMDMERQSTYRRAIATVGGTGGTFDDVTEAALNSLKYKRRSDPLTRELERRGVKVK